MNDTDLAYQGVPRPAMRRTPPGTRTTSGTSIKFGLWRRTTRTLSRSSARLSNFHKFVGIFDGVFVLDVDIGTLQQRLDQRPPDEWGGQPAQRDLIVRLHATREDIPRTGVVVDATRSLEAVVDEIVHLTGMGGQV